MISVSFPNIINPNKVTTILNKDENAINTNLSLLLKSNKGELFGDPNFGTNLYGLLYNQTNTVLKDVIIDTIYTNILLYIPQLAVKRNDITITFSKHIVKINIKALNKQDYSLNTYELELLSNEVAQ